VARKIQLPAVGGIRKVITPGGTSTADLANLQNQINALQAQLNQLQALQHPNTQGSGSEAFLAVRGALQGGGPMVGNVPLTTTGPLVGILEGEQGEQGDIGPPGQAGARGATGPAGAAGPAGADGDPGEDGPPGAQGPQGPAGAAGAAGASGFMLMISEDGADGDPGPPGLPGAPGAAGAAGPPGANVIFPVPGQDGEDGELGFPGPPGRDSNSITQVRGCTWSGGNSAIRQNQMTDVSVIVPEDCDVVRVTILTKGGSGSCQVDVQSAPLAGYGSFSTITGGTLPAISSALTYDNSTLTGWLTHVAASTTLNFHLVSTSVFTEITVMVTLQRTGSVTGSAGYTDAQAVAAVASALANTGNVAFTYSGGAISANTAGATANSWAQSLGSSTGASGYQKLPSGLIIQWGSFSLPVGSTTSVSFPLTFPNYVFAVTTSQGHSTSYGYPFAVESLTTSGFTAAPDCSGGINSGTGYYIAIGR